MSCSFEEHENLSSDLEDYLSSYHYTLDPDDPGYQLQRKQRLRNQPYFELTNFLHERETVQQALERYNMIAVLKKQKENQGKASSKEMKSLKIKGKKKPINFSRLVGLVTTLQQVPGNDDIMNADLGWICRKITEPLASP